MDEHGGIVSRRTACLQHQKVAFACVEIIGNCWNPYNRTGSFDVAVTMKHCPKPAQTRCQPCLLSRGRKRMDQWTGMDRGSCWIWSLLPSFIAEYKHDPKYVQIVQYQCTMEHLLNCCVDWDSIWTLKAATMTWHWPWWSLQTCVLPFR